MPAVFPAKLMHPVLLQLTDQYNLKWRWDWTIADFWCGRHVVCWLVCAHAASKIRTELKFARQPRRHVQNFCFLSIVCFLFRPSFNSTRYAYSEHEGTPCPHGYPSHTPCLEKGKHSKTTPGSSAGTCALSSCQAPQVGSTASTDLSISYEISFDHAHKAGSSSYFGQPGCWSLQVQS